MALMSCVTHTHHGLTVKEASCSILYTVFRSRGSTTADKLAAYLFKILDDVHDVPHADEVHGEAEGFPANLEVW